MNEVKKPRRSLLYYYFIVMLVLILFNTILMPIFNSWEIKQVDYGTFITMTEKGEVGLVEVQDNQIIFTDKDKQTI